MLGNHFDAWVSGGADPHAGTAVTLEIARGLAELRRTGWAPRRTIIIALWDAEEFGVVGSTEWVERHRERLSREAAVDHERARDVRGVPLTARCRWVDPDMRHAPALAGVMGVALLRLAQADVLPFRLYRIR